MLSSPRARAVIAACVVVVGAALVLAGCGGLPDADSGLFGPDDLDAVVTNVGTGTLDALSDIQADPAVQALLLVSGASLPDAPALVTQQTVDTLPRGNFDYDPGTNAWTFGSSDTVFRATWPSGDDTAVGEIDWDAPGATVTVTSPVDGSQREAPTQASATLDVQANQVADVSYEARYADGTDVCGVDGLVDAVPAMRTLDGFIGPVRIDAVSYEIDATGATSVGSVTAQTARAQQRVSWNVTVNAVAPRSAVDCGLAYDTITSLTADLSGRSVFAGITHVIGLAATVDNLVFENEDTLLSLDVQGSLSLGLEPVVDFEGTFDDADGDGVPGEHVTLTYADGSSETLETFLRGVTIGDIVIGSALRAAAARLR